MCVVVLLSEAVQDPGTLAHRLGGRTFPNLHESKVIEPVVHEPLPVCRDDRLEIKELISNKTQAFKKELEQLRQEKADKLRIDQELCRMHHGTALSFSKTLAGLGEWQSFPDVLDTASMVYNATSIAKAAQDQESLTHLVSGWKQRHLGVPRPTPKKTRARQESMCFREGYCHCNRTAMR